MKLWRRAFLAILFVLAVHICAVMAQEATGGLRYSITVSKFENHSNWSGNWAVGDTYGAMLTDSLLHSGKFIVLGETDMRSEAMAEQDFAASGRAAQGQKAPKIGHMTPAQLLVKGEITHFQHSTTGGAGGLRIKGIRLGGGTDKAEINAVIYIVDSTTGQVVASQKVVGEAKRTGLDVGFSDRDWGADLAGFKKTNVGKAMEQAVDESVVFLTGQIEEIPWTGSVVIVKAGKVYINRGEREGVTKGMNFEVGNAEELRDPDTGELLDIFFEKAATISVLTVREKLSICKVTEGEGVERGMTVRLPE